MTLSINFNGETWETAGTVTPGEPVAFQMPASGPASLAVFPAAGGSVLVEVTLSPSAKFRAGQARWLPAAIGTNGTVSAAAAADIITPLTAIRITATGGPAAFECLQ